MKVLGERTKPAEAENLDFFAAAQRATSKISSQIDELAGARAEVALSPSGSCEAHQWAKPEQWDDEFLPALANEILFFAPMLKHPGFSAEESGVSFTAFTPA